MKKLSKITEEYSDLCLTSDTKSLIITKLKNALKEEFNAWYGYIVIKDFLSGMCRPEIEKLYEETAKDELEDHGYWLMKRINELGGTIDDISTSPASWLSAEHGYISPIWVSNGESTYVDIPNSLIVNIENEKGAIETYRDIIALAKEAKDYTTEKKCKEILADEEEHLQLLIDFLDDIKNTVK